MNSCSSEGDEDEEPAIKAQRERERRQANNARERYNKPIDKKIFRCENLFVKSVNWRLP